MGIDISAARFLIGARSMNVDFTTTAMIGRQALYLTPRELKSELRRAGIEFDAAAIDSIFCSSDGYAEQLLRFLGAKEVHSIDASAYEGATHIHNMNQPIPDHFRQCYDVVLDGGSLEHIFDFPTSIRNCMEMVGVGGHFISIAPANNFLGHGFYQLSPGIYFSVLNETNGFRLREIILSEERASPRWFDILNLQNRNVRVEHINNCPTYLLVLAQRYRICQLFEHPPEQSDYLAAWNSGSDQAVIQRSLRVASTRLMNWLRIRLPYRLRHLLVRRKMALLRSRHFHAITDRTCR